MKTYMGDRTIDGILVTVNGKPLDTRAATRTFSSMGFEWGYDGPEPRQLAFAILADHLGDMRVAETLSASFMTELVANFDNEWTLTTTDIDTAIVDLGWSQPATALTGDPR